MEGEDEDSDNPRAFNNVNVFKRMVIVIAGALMNILFGLALMLITLLPQSVFSSTTISSFEPYSFTAVTGLQEGDKIVEINGYDIYSANDFNYALYTTPLEEVDGNELSIYKEDCVFELRNFWAKNYTDKTQQQIDSAYAIWLDCFDKITEAKDKDTTYKLMCECIDKVAVEFELEDYEYPEIQVKESRKRFRTDIEVVRDGQRVELTNVDFFTYLNTETEEPSLSIDFHVVPIKKTFSSVISQTFTQTVSVVRMIWATLGGLVTGQFGINDVSGPVGLASAITDVASVGLERSFISAVMNIVYVMMVISVNLGIVNMLPFPALDGGRFVFLLIEAIFRKPVPRKFEYIVNGIGLALLMLLMIVITFKDIFVLISGG